MPGRPTSDEKSSQTSALGQTFGNGATWQASSGIWGSNTIGSGFANTKRDASHSRGRFERGLETLAEADIITAAGSNDFPERPSGSGALAASSEADPWVARASGPWNPPDTTSPTLQSSHSGSTSPTHVRGSVSTAAPQKTLLEIQNSYPQARPTNTQGASFSRSQPKSRLDPSSGSFDFVRKPSFGFSDDKENSTHFPSNPDAQYDMDISSRTFRVDQVGSQNATFLSIGSSASRDGSMPPSRASDSGLNGGSAFGNPSFGSIAHTPTSSIHSQRPSFSGLSGSYPSQVNGSRYTDLPTQTDLELREKFARFGLKDAEQAAMSQVNNNTPGTSYTPNHPNFAQQHYQVNGGLAVWNDVSTGPKTFSYDYANQPFADQPYFSGKSSHFGGRGSISPAGSDYHRQLNSPRYRSAAGTPPSGSDHIYRPSSRGPRNPQGRGEMDQRIQNMHYTQQQQQQQAYLYGGHFQGQYPPHAYDYPSQGLRSGLPYGYPVPVPVYPPSQVVPTRPAKDQDIGHGVRSVLLEEFRSSNSKSNKRYELKASFNNSYSFLTAD